MKTILSAFLLCFAAWPLGAVTVTQLMGPKVYFTDNNGKPCSGCKFWTYAAGTTTPQLTYSGPAGTSANTNPVLLDASGRADIFITETTYKFVLETKSDLTHGTVLWTQDNYTAASILNVPFPVSIANGGTGTATPALVAGTGIGITGGWPNNTITGVSPFDIHATVNATPTGCDDYSRYQFGAFPQSSEFGGCSVPITQGLLSAMWIPNNSPAQLVCAVCSYLTGPGGSSPAESTVGGFFAAFAQSSSNLGTWAGNFTVFNYPPLLGPQAGLAGNIEGVEIDLNTSATGSAPANAAGAAAVSAAIQAPTGYYSGFQSQILASTGYQQFKAGFRSFTGCCTVGFEADPLTFTGASTSQPLQFIGRKSDTSAALTQIQGDSSGSISVASAPTGSVSMQDTSGLSFLLLNSASAVFNAPVVPKGVSALPTPVSSEFVYCTTCTVSACATPGTGAWAFYNSASAAWTCPF